MSDALRRLGARLRQLVGFGKAALVDDSQPQQMIQLQVFVGGDADLHQVLDQVVRLGEYGFFSVPPEGAEAVVLFPGGDKSGGVIVATGHRPSRPKDMQPGEAGLYNGVTGALLRMGADGKAHLSCDLVVDGDITDCVGAGNTATVKALRDAYDAHKHGGVQTGGGVTGNTDHNV